MVACWISLEKYLEGDTCLTWIGGLGESIEIGLFTFLFSTWPNLLGANKGEVAFGGGRMAFGCLKSHFEKSKRGHVLN